MSVINSDLYVSAISYGQLQSTDSESWFRRDCPYCGGAQMTLVGRTNGRSEAPRVMWLRCVNCRMGVVVNNDEQSPGAKPLDVPKGVEGDDLAAWEEVRSCLAVGARTAAVMMCRKLLFHIAVSEGLPERKDNGRAPGFAEAMDHLENEWVVTKRMRAWADRVKDVGNEANHELTGYTFEQALDIARFTRQLLHLSYELPLLAASGDGDSAAD